VEHIPAFFFDPQDLERHLSEVGGPERFRAATPFPHVVLDDFVPPEVIRRLIAEFPGEDDIEWETWGPGRTRPVVRDKSNKLGQSDEQSFPPFIRHFMSQLLSETFVKFVERLSGIEGLIVDPSHNGCGLHSTGRGGRLMIHTDVNRHPHTNTRLHQVLNLIVFLNDEWRDEYHGHLELWTPERKPCKRILPIANRAVLFETGTRSFHGHPEPLACEEGRRRNSLAVYYYCLDRAPSDDYDGLQRSVRWIPTSNEDRSVAARSARRAERMSVEMSGRSARLGAGFVPIQIDDAGMYVTILHEASLSEETRTAVRAEHMQSMFDSDPDLLDRYYVIGYVSALRDASISDREARLLVCSRDDGAVYLEHPQTGRALFCGYFERLERLIAHTAT
jgi:hypothetical protein